MKKIDFKRWAALIVWVAAIILMLTACDSDLDVKQVYGFDLETMPVQKKITKGETAEIRCQIIREGNYLNDSFQIRYFQTDGYGKLCLEDGTVLLPNDLYPLEKETFRLYFTALSDEQQVIDIFIINFAGQTIQRTFSFQNASSTSGEDNE